MWRKHPRRESGRERGPRGGMKLWNSMGICSRYRLTQGKTLAQKMEGVPRTDAHVGDAPTPVLNYPTLTVRRLKISLRGQ